MAFSTGDRVKWSWGAGTGEGVIAEVFVARVTRTIKGSEITRDADDSSYLIEQDDGDRVLKSRSEIEPAD